MDSRFAYRQRAVAFALSFLCVALPSQAEHLPFKYLSTLNDRWSAAEIVCTATVSEVVATGDLPVIEGTKLTEYLVSARVDRIFKGTWTEQRIAFQSFGLYSPDGIVQYIGPPTADFRSHSRYLLFLRNETTPEVITPVFGTAILLAPQGAATQYLHLVPPGGSADKVALAAEMIAAIYAEPPQLRNSADYFGHIGELLRGSSAAHLFETFYKDDDGVLRVVAARMALGWSPDDPFVKERASKVLLGVAADSSAPESSRADAILKLAEMGAQEARPYAEQIALRGKDAWAREFALRALVRVGTRTSEDALIHALDDPFLVNQFLAVYALQQIECGTLLDEEVFRQDSQRIVAYWKDHASRPLGNPPCRGR